MVQALKKNSERWKIDPVLARIVVGTGAALCVGLFLTGIMNVSESAAMQMEVPERSALEREIAQRSDELAQLEKNNVQAELKDEELRELEAEMARIDSGKYTQLKRNVINANLAWFLGSLAALIMTIVLARWMKNKTQGKGVEGEVYEKRAKNEERDS